MDHQVRQDGAWSRDEISSRPLIAVTSSKTDETEYLGLDMAAETLATLNPVVAGADGALPGCLKIRTDPKVFKQAMAFWYCRHLTPSTTTPSPYSMVFSLQCTSTTTPPYSMYERELLVDILQHCNEKTIRLVKRSAPANRDVLLTVLELMNDGKYNWLSSEAVNSLLDGLNRCNDDRKDPETDKLNERYKNLDAKLFKHLMLNSGSKAEKATAQAKRKRA